MNTGPLLNIFKLKFTFFAQQERSRPHWKLHQKLPPPTLGYSRKFSAKIGFKSLICCQNNYMESKQIFVLPCYEYYPHQEWYFYL